MARNRSVYHASGLSPDSSRGIGMTVRQAYLVRIKTQGKSESRNISGEGDVMIGDRKYTTGGAPCR